MTDTSKPKCPWCKTAKKVCAAGGNGKVFFCGRCHRRFDPTDDGDLGYGRPDRIVERAEQAELRARGMSSDSELEE